MLSLDGCSWNSSSFHAGSHLGISPPIHFGIEWMLNEKSSTAASCTTFSVFFSMTVMLNGQTPTLEKRLDKKTRYPAQLYVRVFPIYCLKKISGVNCGRKTLE